MKTFRDVAADIGTEAIDLISKDRAKTHGHALVQHQVAADLWTAYLKGRGKLNFAPLTAHEVAMLLMLLKASRDAVGSRNRDNFVDAVGYACLAGAIREFEEIDNAGVQEGWTDRPAEAPKDRGETATEAWGGGHGKSAIAFGGERRAKFGQ
jgi:hypothetical protein